MNVDKEGLLVIGEGMMTDSRNQSPENSKVPFCESESLIKNVNRCVETFYLSHHELLMNEFRCILNENVLDVRRMIITSLVTNCVY